ncbi:alpha/beta hydrolase [Limosilactobacillus fastidiosus]|uniref:Alpha/beta hydrolase n=1 Tax=Limosilactobacillus fastidiosus TaxID=2759855 RepID=A0A7W3U0B4_9LACO|nr:alpha/beta hydrolase [Limosilactobacillus fastidiosus]MBB1062212.1 alpha/beta hydrolase [Limosilactobacillus fastidiosus]MBB1086587.1 alpha/beta hydrolase [Limosilactobacillus fastidiosus]MCD7084416.1 alpha/beta hydrolase [Limosilactobacillus fastidiosus]MCD7086563.1 alpha/beta hydrolase [Limosilactobacillus fastidiosus]MCD7115271.1 alpha/beta hydrolase [Limosilactobacillus fastidiosus]
MLKIEENPRKKSRQILISLIIVLILIALPTYIWMKHSNKYLALQEKSRMSPVIMVPGSSATKERFNQLIRILNKNTEKKHSVLKMEVYNNGKITYNGTVTRNDNEPFIIISFENNKDGLSNIKKQASMLNEAFSELTNQYYFNNFKAFGHSNGGLIWTYWLEHYYSEYDDQIKIKSLMTLGTPYNFAEKSINTPTQMFTELIKYRDKLPKKLNVFSIAGTENYDSDGLVPEESVQAGKYIFQKRVAHYTTMTVTGDEAQHSSLPQNKQIVKIIEQYLLDGKNPNNPVNRRGASQNNDDR